MFLSSALRLFAIAHTSPAARPHNASVGIEQLQSMPEVPLTGEDHHHTETIGGSDHFIVFN